MDLAINQITDTLFSLSGRIDYEKFDSDLFNEIDKAGLDPIDSGIEVTGAYPPPHSCQESVVIAGDRVHDAIDDYEEALAKQAFLLDKTDEVC